VELFPLERELTGYANPGTLVAKPISVIFGSFVQFWQIALEDFRWWPQN
jgi:hypothetical protein